MSFYGEGCEYHAKSAIHNSHPTCASCHGCAQEVCEEYAIWAVVNVVPVEELIIDDIVEVERDEKEEQSRAVKAGVQHHLFPKKACHAVNEPLGAEKEQQDQEYQETERSKQRLGFISLRTCLLVLQV